MMLKRFSRITAIMVAVIMVFTSLSFPGFSLGSASIGQPAAYAEETADPLELPEVEDVSPVETMEVITYIQEALSKFSSNPEEMSKVALVIERFGGVTELLAGGMAILQMLGIIEDPTEKALAEILSEIINVQDQLSNMDRKLDDITTQLISMAAIQEERSRAQNARTLLSYWRKFNTDYREPLTDLIAEYQGMINGSVKEWWQVSDHESTRLLYTKLKGELSLTYSSAPYEPIPDKADNGEVIEKEACIGIPSTVMPKTSDISFSVDTYKEKFTERFVPSFVKAADQKKLDAAESFYTKWASCTDEQKTKMAEKYAADALNTIIYRISCETMSNNDKFVIRVMNAYRHYCENIIMADSGVDALINVQYLTHGFEGEVKKDVQDVCDSMIAMAGVYGTFALTCASQDSMQSRENKKNLQALWVKTIKTLDSKKKSALTGHDNFCYIAGGLLEYRELNVYSLTTLKYRQVMRGTTIDHVAISSTPSNYELHNDKDEKQDLPSMLGDSSSIVLYHQYARQKGNDQTYAKYLAKYRVNIPGTFEGKLMTAYKGAEVLPLSAGLTMRAKYAIGTYFEDYEDYDINRGNPSKIENDYFMLHDKLVYNYQDTANGAVRVNEILGARAVYMEDHWYWHRDEMAFFYRGFKLDYSEEQEHGERSIDTYYTAYMKTRVPVHFLAIVKYRMDDLEDTSPLKAFDQCYLAEEDYEARDKETKADWSKLRINYLNLYNSNDKEIDTGINNEIVEAVAEAKEKGLNVSFDEAEETRLAAKMKHRFFETQKELQSNKSLNYTDVFGIEGNDEAETALAKAVLQAAYLDYDNNPKVSPENMKTMVRYSPGSSLCFEEKEGKAVPVISPLFVMEPILVVWDSKQKTFVSFVISDEVMKTLGLKMKVRVPAGMAKGEEASIVQMYGEYDRKVYESGTGKVKGKAKSRYAEVTTDRCGPFEITNSVSNGTMIAAGKAIKIKSKSSKLKKTRQITAKKAYTINGEVGNVTFKKVKANKLSQKFKVNAKTGRITVGKGLKRGTYKLTVKITDSGDDYHKRDSTNVIVTIRVKAK